MIGTIDECKFFSIGELGELLYQKYHNTVRYTSFKNDTWEFYENDIWNPTSAEQIHQMFIDYITNILNEYLQTLNMKYFSYVGDYERTRICDKITKIQKVLKNIRTTSDKYGNQLLEETRSHLHFIYRETN